MAAFIAKQPNGLYCRFSTVVDTVTHYNMTFNDYVSDVQMGIYGRNKQEAEQEAKYTIEHYLKPFQEVIDRFVPNNQTKEEFNQLLEKMGYIETLNINKSNMKQTIEQAACIHWSESTYKEDAEFAYDKHECIAVTALARHISLRAFKAGVEWNAKQNPWRNFKDEHPKPNSYILRRMISPDYQSYGKAIYYVDFWGENRPNKWKQDDDRVVYEWKYINEELKE